MKQLACDLHDYLEIACMFGYQVKLTLQEAEVCVGKATNIVISKQRRESLVIETADKQLMHIDTSDIKHLDVLTPNARFSSVAFD